jgi:hypothetical protein
VLLTAYLEENVASGQEFFDELTNDKDLCIIGIPTGFLLWYGLPA